MRTCPLSTSRILQQRRPLHVASYPPQTDLQTALCLQAYNADNTCNYIMQAGREGEVRPGALGGAGGPCHGPEHDAAAGPRGLPTAEHRELVDHLERRGAARELRVPPALTTAPALSGATLALTLSTWQCKAAQHVEIISECTYDLGTELLRWCIASPCPSLRMQGDRWPTTCKPTRRHHVVLAVVRPWHVCATLWRPADLHTSLAPECLLTSWIMRAKVAFATLRIPKTYDTL